jgi:Phosphotransferase enzyme family
MNNLRIVDVAEISALAASTLSSVSGSMVKIEEMKPLGNEQRRNFVGRARAIDENGRTRSIIVKATRSPSYDPAAADALENSGLVREWVAVAYIGARAPGRGHGSGFLSGDVSRGLMIFEDLGTDLASLVDPLLRGTAKEAERALTLYAAALGRLHADTADCLASHHETFQSVFGISRPRRRSPQSVEKEAEVVVDRLGGAPPASELELLSMRVADPGPWQCLIHGDPCPDNALIVDGSMRLIDYEHARPSHALLDGIYWQIGFPTCWCAGRVPADVASRIDDVYRVEIARVMPLAGDQATYRAELAYAAAIWLFGCFTWHLDAALKDDSTWGIWSIRGRLLWYLQAVIEMTTRANVLPGINGAAHGWLLELQRRWPDSLPLGFYPAFTTSAI